MQKNSVEYDVRQKPPASWFSAGTVNLITWIMIFGGLVLMFFQPLESGIDRWIGAGIILFAAVVPGYRLERRQSPPWFDFGSNSSRIPPVQLDAPLSGICHALNSPTAGIPSHGTHTFAQTFAIDLIPDPENARDNWKFGLFGFPAPDRHPGFGSPVYSPVDGEVVDTVNSEPDHRIYGVTLFGIIFFYFMQLINSIRSGTRLSGNYVLIKTDDDLFVYVAHLKQHSIKVKAGDRVSSGQQIADCGNSGNSTEPHVHLHVMNNADPQNAYGIPFVFRKYQALDSGEWIGYRKNIPGPAPKSRQPWKTCRFLRD